MNTETQPIETFSASQVECAVEQFLEYGEQQHQKSHQGYYSGAGWAARCLRYHLDQLKSGRSTENAPYIMQPVQNPRYSECATAKLKDLDWERGWWTDHSFGQHYLHVHHRDGETIHRVFCRGHRCPRLEMKRGVLYWLFPKEKQKAKSRKQK